MIVGFPGETEADFALTLELVRDIGFAGLFGFKYSERPHTPAQKLAEDVDEGEKSERLERLFLLADSIRLVVADLDRRQTTQCDQPPDFRRQPVVFVESLGAGEQGFGRLVLRDFRRKLGV